MQDFPGGKCIRSTKENLNSDSPRVSRLLNYQHERARAATAATSLDTLLLF